MAHRESRQQGEHDPFDPRRRHARDFVAWETQLSPHHRNIAGPLMFGFVGFGAIGLLLLGASLLGAMVLVVTVIIAILWGSEPRGGRTR